MEQANTYDAAGNLIAQATNNGATTTDYTVDAGDRTTSETLDPSGLDRTTSISYTPDDYVASETLTGPGSSTPVRSTSYTYDAMGNMTSQSQALQGGGNGPTAWWPLNQTSGTTVPDATGTGHTATASGVSWSNGAENDGRGHNDRSGARHDRLVHRVRLGEPDGAHRERADSGLAGRHERQLGLHPGGRKRW